MKKYKNNIISFILACILTICIWHNFLISGNNIIFVFIFASCYFVIKKTLESTKNTKRKMITAGIVAFIYTIIEIIGKSINTDFTLDHILAAGWPVWRLTRPPWAMAWPLWTKLSGSFRAALLPGLLQKPRTF